MVKFENFSKNPKKKQYVYLLTPEGLKQKSKLTLSFVRRKRLEFQSLREEINLLENELDIESGSDLSGMNKEKFFNHAIDKELTCFKSYDVRGEIGTSFDEAIVYKIARALSQHLNCEKVVIGYDARETSPGFAKAATQE